MQNLLAFRIEDKGFGACMYSEYEQVGMTQKKREFSPLGAQGGSLPAFQDHKEAGSCS